MLLATIWVRDVLTPACTMTSQAVAAASPETPGGLEGRDAVCKTSDQFLDPFSLTIRCPLARPTSRRHVCWELIRHQRRVCDPVPVGGTFPSLPATPWLRTISPSAASCRQMTLT